MAIRLCCFLLTLLLLSCSQKEDHTTLIWVRHAEKDTLDLSPNPGLTAEGKMRAKNLRSALDSLNISAVFSTEFDRNIQTVMPLAADQGLDIRLYKRDSWPSLLDTLPSYFRDETILICGHGDQILNMIAYLGAPTERKHLDKNEYDKIFILRQARTKPQLQTILY